MVCIKFLLYNKVNILSVSMNLMTLRFVIEVESYKEEIETLFLPTSLLNGRDSFLLNLVGCFLSPPAPVL